MIFARKPPAPRLLPVRLRAYRRKLRVLAPDLLVTYKLGFDRMGGSKHKYAAHSF